MFGDFYDLDNVPVFVCVQTRLRSGLVFVLLVALSDVYMLGNCLCSTGEHSSPPGVPGQLRLSGALGPLPASPAPSPGPGTQQLCPTSYERVGVQGEFEELAWLKPRTWRGWGGAAGGQEQASNAN